MLGRLLRSNLIRWGLWVLAVGVGPLLLILAAAKLGLTRDPNPNPVGPGLLAALSFWPGVIMVAAGVFKELFRKSR